jgi:TonB family protein
MSRRSESEDLNHLYSDGDAKRASGLSYWLIHHAARSAPELLSQRLEEEWLADLAVRSSAASRLRFALGCCWATRVIAHEHSMSAALAVTPGLGAKSMMAYAHHNFGLFSRRTTAVGLVACLHIAVFYAFMVGLPNTFTKVNTPPLQNRELQQTHARDMPPLPPPNLNPMKLDVPKLDPNVTSIAEEDPEVIRAAGPQELPPTHGAPERISPPQVLKQVQGGPGAGFPNPDDYYPTLARRLEEQGVATVRVCVDANGRLTSDPTAIEGTGSARLDEGALKLARAGSGHYRASTEDGRPVNSCYPFRIRFQIKN